MRVLHLRSIPAFALLVLVSGLLAAGCGDSERPRRGSRPAPAAGRPADGPGLSRGEHRIHITHDLVRIEADQAPLSAVLDELALRMGVDVTVAPGLGETPVRVDVEAPDLPRALPALLRGLDFEARYEPFADGAVRVTAIRVAPAPTGGVAAPSGASARGPSPPRSGSVAPTGRRDAAEDEDDWREGSEALSQDEALAQLARGSREERVEAIHSIEVEGPGLRALIDVLANDGDPAVRTAAAEQLEDADGYAGVEALVAALRDPEVRVVRAAIESLEFAGDESVIPALEPLLDHPDPDVRRDAEDAIEFLRD